MTHPRVLNIFRAPFPKEVTLGAALSEGLRMKSEDLTNTVAEAHPGYWGKGIWHFCFVVLFKRNLGHVTLKLSGTIGSLLLFGQSEQS